MFPEGFLAEGHAAVLAYAAALKSAPDGTVDSLRSALEGLVFETATGTRTLRAEDHQAIKPVVTYRVRGADNADGIEVMEYRVIDGALTIEPPSPGQAIQW